MELRQYLLVLSIIICVDDNSLVTTLTTTLKGDE